VVTPPERQTHVRFFRRAGVPAGAAQHDVVHSERR
jgi:hypothetical protein